MYVQTSCAVLNDQASLLGRWWYGDNRMRSVPVVVDSESINRQSIVQEVESSSGVLSGVQRLERLLSTNSC